MRINIVTTIDNGVGLQVEARILRKLLTDAGHRVSLVHRYQPEKARPADLNIFIEIISDAFFRVAGRQWFIPNPEWYYPEAWDEHLAKVHLVLCKTRDAERLFRLKHPRVVYTGFMSLDWHDPAVERRRSFIHVQGKSKYKNTQAVLEAWRSCKPDADLTLVSSFEADHDDLPGVKRLSYVPPGTLRALMNNRLFHLCPSAYEGFGHYIHEALGCGAVVCTTDHSPMKDIVGCPSELHIPVADHYVCQLATMAVVTPTAVAETVQRCLSLDEDAIAQFRMEARRAYETETEDFKNRLLTTVAKLE